MENSKRPFLYTLIPCGDQNQDYLFKRIRGSTTEEHGPNIWAMHMDIEDPTPESVLIFVQGTTPPEETKPSRPKRTLLSKSNRFFRKKTN